MSGVSISKLRKWDFKFTILENYVCYNDEENSYVLSQGLVSGKKQQTVRKTILKQFICKYKEKVGVSASGQTDNIDEYKPLLVKIIEKDKKFEDNLISFFSFLNNSSIWVRIIYKDDPEAEKKAQQEFAVFKEMGLYNYKSAKENFDFNSRIQSENWLQGDHGHDVTPVLYGDERKSLDILVINNQTLDNNEQPKTDSENNQQSDNNAQQPTSSENNQQSTPCEKLWKKIKSFWEWFKDLVKSLGKKIEDKKKPSEDTGDGTNPTEEKGGEDARQQVQLENDTVLFDEKEQLKGMFKHMEKFHDIALRILLIDDKLGPEDNELGQTNKYKLLFKKKSEPSFDIDAVSIEMKRCKKEKCQTCKRLECKLRVLKQLMDDGEDVNTKNTIFDGIGKTKDYFYWKESDIETYYCPTIIEDFIDNDEGLDFSDFDNGINVYSASNTEEENKRRKDNALNIKCDFTPEIKKDDLHVQIVGVRDVRTALLLLSKYKFDMIFSDYLLDKKIEKSEEREYANQLFKFLNRKQITNEQKKEYRELLKLKKEGNLPDDKKGPFKHLSKRNALETLRHDVLDNRGPLGQLWIMPITGFNQTFIQDIYRDGTNLIDYKWNISNGADPITTPWQFLYHLNMFIELQLRSSVYRTEQLLQFLKYTCDDLEELNNAQEDKKKKLNFDDFKSFMGSEYATFTQLYGNKLPIKRDALTEGESDYNSDSKSVFATYVWKNFYADKDAYNVVELCRLMHRFYYLASYMYNDRVGTQRLNEAFANLLFFVRTNRRVQSEIKNNVDFNELLEKTELLREIVSKYTNNQQEKN